MTGRRGRRGRAGKCSGGAASWIQGRNKLRVGAVWAAGKGQGTQTHERTHKDTIRPRLGSELLVTASRGLGC